MLAFGPVSNARQVFQAEETGGMGVQDLFGDRMIGAQLQPSLSQRQGEASPGRATSAFALEPFLDAGVVVGCGSHLHAASRTASDCQEW